MDLVTLSTNLGDIVIEVDEKLCPVTAKNFLTYCEEGFYDNTIFHRVIDKFMIQGGGMTANLVPKQTHDPIINEAALGLKNSIGTVAMARTNDPHSATCQFFINVADNSFLNFKSENESGFGYCAFAKVVDGIDVVNKIALTNTVNKAYHQDVPEADIVILKTTISQAAYA
jgi:peptidyl-prolyl cis-trans isomerase B (cyclophilin B)